MKILQISSLIPYPPTDGGKLSVYGLIKSLAEKGHKIDLVCYQKHNDYKSSYDALKEFCEPHILDVKADNSIRGAVKNLFSPIPYNASKYYSKFVLDYVKKLLALKNFDIIQINHLHLGWLSAHLRQITKTPLVMRSQNIETMIMKRYSEQVKNPVLKLFSWFQYKKLLKYEPSIYSGFDLCITISENDCAYLKMKLPAINAVSIPAGVDKNLFLYKKKSVKLHSIAHIGHTDWYPNYDSLNWFINEILPKILERYPDTRLFVFGGGNTRNFPVPEKMRRNVEVIGFVEDLWDNLSHIDLAIVPLRIGGGIRIKILELLASGNLIVTTTIGKEGINVEDGKHLIIADTANEFADKICKVFEGYETAQIISNGRTFIRDNYIWEVISDKFQDHFQKLIADQNSVIC